MARRVTQLPCHPCVRVAVMGANTPTGVVASRYIKTSKYVHELRLHDQERLVKATALDLRDVDTCCEVREFVGADEGKCALVDVDIVLVAVGRSEGDPAGSAQIFNENAASVGDAICLVGSYAPCAKIVIVSEPVNSMVPFAAEILLQMNKLDYGRILGSTMDPLRAAAVMAQVTGLRADRVSVTVVGGRSASTAVPVFSGMRPWATLPDSIRDSVLDGVLNDVRSAWCSQTSLLASLPEGGYLVRGVAAARTVLALARALHGYKETLCAMVRSDLLPTQRYMVSQVDLSRDGITKNLGIPSLQCQELRNLEAALPILQQDVQRGEEAGRKFLLELPKFATGFSG